MTSMLQQPSTAYDKILKKYFLVAPLQATAVEMARASMQGRKMHLRALCVSLASTQKKLDWVLQHLIDTQDGQTDQLAENLAGATMALQGALDGFVMLDLADSNNVARQVTAHGTSCP